MAKERIGTASVEVDASTNKMGASLVKAADEIKKFKKEAEKETGGGFFEGLAKQAKEARRNARKSGESSLEKLLGGGGSLAEFGLRSVGMGMQAVVTDVIGKHFSATTDMFAKMASGEMSQSTAINEWAKGLPILGDFVKGWSTIIDLTTGEAAAARDLNKVMKEQEESAKVMATLRNASKIYDEAAFANMSPIDQRLAKINENRIDRLQPITEQRDELLSPTEEEIRKEMGFWKSYASDKWYVKWMNPDAVAENYEDAAKSILAKRGSKIAGLDASKRKIEKAAPLEAEFALEQEAHRREISLLDIDRRLEAGRIAIWKSGAKDAKSIWLITAREINDGIDTEIKQIQSRLKFDHTLSAAESVGLNQRVSELMQQRPAMVGRAGQDYWRSIYSDRASASSSLFGMSGSMIARLGQFPGGSSQATQKTQRLLDAYSFSVGMDQQLKGFINDPKHTTAQRKAASGLLGLVGEFTKLGTSDAFLNQQQYVPLRFANADLASDYYSGAAAYAREKDLSSDPNAQTSLEVQKLMKDLLEQIDTKLGQMLTTHQDGEPVFPDASN